jgi:ubiquilin
MSDDQISIKIKQTNNNQSFDITILKSNTVLDLKSAIKEQSGLENNQQNLVYKGRILADEKLVSDYNIQEGHTIILVKKVSQDEKDKIKKEETTNTTTTTNTNTNNNQNNFNNMFGNIGGMGGMGLGSGLGSGLSGMEGLGGNMDMNTAMNMLNNPQMQQMMNQVLNFEKFLKIFFIILFI